MNKVSVAQTLSIPQVIGCTAPSTVYLKVGEESNVVSSIFRRAALRLHSDQSRHFKMYHVNFTWKGELNVQIRQHSGFKSTRI